MRRRRVVGRLTAFTGVALLAGCVDILGIVGHRPLTIVERDGLSYQVIVTESPHDYDAFEYRVRITNTSRSTIERSLPARLAHPRVYRDEHWSRPVWDDCAWGCGYHDYDRVAVRLRRGEAIEGWWGEVWARDFAERRGGVYHLTLVIDTGRNRFEVLGLPELWVR